LVGEVTNAEHNSLTLSTTYFNCSCMLLLTLLLILTLVAYFAFLIKGKKKIASYSIIAVGGMLLILFFILLTIPMWWPPYLCGSPSFRFHWFILPHNLLFLGLLTFVGIYFRKREYGKFITIAAIAIGVLWLSILLTIPFWMPPTLFKVTG